MLLPHRELPRLPTTLLGRLRPAHHRRRGVQTSTVRLSYPTVPTVIETVMVIGTATATVISTGAISPWFPLRCLSITLTIAHIIRKTTPSKRPRRTRSQRRERRQFLKTGRDTKLRLSGLTRPALCPRARWQPTRRLKA